MNGGGDFGSFSGQLAGLALLAKEAIMRGNTFDCMYERKFADILPRSDRLHDM